MTRPRTLVAALAAAGVIVAAAGVIIAAAGVIIAAAGVINAVSVAYESTRPERLAMAPVDPALCRLPGSGGWQSLALFKAAFAADQPAPAPRPEVKPFDYAVEGTSPEAEDNPPLWGNLGALSMPITTADPAAQRYFNQGLTLAFGFNHNEALRAFRKAQQLDPNCAMCYWGDAYVLGPNINAPMDTSAVGRAVSAAARAQELAASATPVEQALIRAIVARYSADSEVPRATLDAAYASAMGEAARAFQDDQNVNVLFAEAVMDLSPWDYWEADAVRAKGRMGEAIAALEQVLRANAAHPGAIHLYIHAVEASTDPKRAEAYADRLGALVPGAGHLVHMPSHIYYRVGRYLDSLEANRRAVAVDEAYFARYKATGIYPNAYYPHNVHFLLVSAQMAGDGKAVIESARKLDEVISNYFAKVAPFAQTMKAAPYFAHVQFSTPETILALPDPGNGIPFIRAMWHYARGVAQARRSDFAGAQSAGSGSPLRRALSRPRSMG